MRPQDEGPSLDRSAAAYRRGDLAAALDEGRRLLEAEPKNAHAWNNLGVYLHRAGQPAAAMEACARALVLQPGYPKALNNLGTLLREQGSLDEAERHFVEALAGDPAYADAASNLGTVCNERGDYAGAVRHFLDALRLDPAHVDATGHLGAVLSPLGHPEAETRLRRAVALRPEDPEKQLNLAMHLMRRGNFTEGWALYEARWHMPRGEMRLPVYPQPRWEGEPLQGRTLLLHTEQGFGDAFQFLRFVPLLLARGAQVVLHVQAALAGLLEVFAQRYPGQLRVVLRQQPPPAFDVHTPLLSVPRLLGTTPEAIPPPLRLTPPSPPRAAGRPRVGLVWAGSATHLRDMERSLQLSWLAPVLEVPGTEFVSLQAGPQSAQIAQRGVALEQPAVRTWLETAEVLDTLDLVIAVDTAVAHLAATQGLPVWLMLPLAADWRWDLTVPGAHPEPGSLWYPGMRLFRQKKMAGRAAQQLAWSPVVGQVSRSLAEWVHARGDRG